MTTPNTDIKIDPSMVQKNIIEGEINKFVREHLYRLAARVASEHVFKDIYERLTLLIVAETPDVWFHRHNIGSFVENINQNRDYLMFLIGIDNNFRSSLNGLGIDTEIAIRHLYAGLHSIKPFQEARVDKIIEADLLERWPDADSIVAQIKHDAILLTILAIHKYCSLSDLNKYVIKDSGIELILKAKNRNENT